MRSFFFYINGIVCAVFFGIWQGSAPAGFFVFYGVAFLDAAIDLALFRIKK